MRYYRNKEWFCEYCALNEALPKYQRCGSDDCGEAIERGKTHLVDEELDKQDYDYNKWLLDSGVFHDDICAY